MEKKPIVGSFPKWRWLKILFEMKLVLFLILVFSLSASAGVYSQNQRVNLEFENATILDVLNEIKSQTGIRFFYNDENLTELETINIDVSDQRLDEVLEDIFEDTDLKVVFEDDVILILDSSEVKKEVKQEQQKPTTIRGKVTDNTGAPMPGVTVMIKDTYVGSSTDVNGVFVINSPTQKGEIVISSIGFKTQTVKYSGKEPLMIKLEVEYSDLDEVTVVAYGESNKRKLVSSVSSVKAAELKEVPSASLENVLQGRMAGVHVQNTTGAPGGGGNKIIIRGYNTLFEGGQSSSEPLYVIDGVPMQSFTSPVTGTNTISDLNPENIERIDVLKDAASAALYGSRAANGVILITTKKGKIGESKFKANVSHTWSYNPEYPKQYGGNGLRQLYMDMMINDRAAYYAWQTQSWLYPNSYEEAKQSGWGQYDRFWNSGREEVYSGGGIMLDSLNPAYNNSTNWYEHMFRTGKVLNANIQASGGSKNMQYMVGAGIYDQDGIMINSGFRRIDGLINLNANLNKRMRLVTRHLIAYTDRSNGDADRFNSNNIEGMTVDPSSTSSLEGTRNEYSMGGNSDDAFAYLRESVNIKDSYRINSMLGMYYTPIKGLEWRNTFSWDFVQHNSNSFQPDYLFNLNQSQSSGAIERNQELNYESILSYNTSIKENHNLELMAGYTFNKKIGQAISGYAKGGITNTLHYVGQFGWPSTYESGNQVFSAKGYNSDFYEIFLISYFGRLNYNYKNKFLLNATYRRDGSSTFGINNVWGIFPSVGAGWVFSEESWLKNAKWLDFAKLRASWGKTGRPFNSPYLAHGLIYMPPVNFQGKPVANAMSINMDLEWEKADQYDIGLDFDLFNYRVKGKFDYYYRKTYDMLYLVSVPGDATGAGEMWQNAMDISNEGLELELEFDVLRDSKVKWRTKLNFARNWNKFLKSHTGRDIGSAVIGKPLNQLRVYKDDGYYTSEDEIPYRYTVDGQKVPITPLENGYIPRVGMRKIVDVNGNGIIDPYFADKIYGGSTLPKLTGGWSNELKWKNFDLSLLFTFTLNRNVINTATMNGVTSVASEPLYADPREYTYFGEAGNSADYPDLAKYPGTTQQYGPYLLSQVENVSFIRLKSLVFGYNFSKELMQKIGLEGGRLFFTGENLFLLHNYSGVDPESIPLGNGLGTSGMYPLPRNLTLGVTLNF